MKQSVFDSYKPRIIVFIYLLCWLAVYLYGLFVPLLDSDSGHHAMIGLRIYLTGNYTDLVDRGRDYLDKPHLLFWLGALGDWLIGVNTAAFKLPSLLCAAVGIYATYRLGTLLYNAQTGRNAAIILLSTQAFILALNDVRMDGLLLSLMIIATWLLYEYVLNQKVLFLITGSFALAMAFSTKGMSGAIPPIIAVASQVIYTRNWRFIRSFRWLLVLPLFFIFITPVLYSYYVQYDLHPEKVIRGMTNISGIKFILFYQNVERLQGDSWGNAGSKDPFLFFHSLLWAMLPWCILGYWAFIRRSVSLVKERLQYTAGKEILSFTTILVMFTIMSLSNFKLPHYLNILFPYFAILIAGQLNNLQSLKTQRWFLIIQKVIAVLLVAGAIAINSFLFPVTSFGLIAISLIALYLFYWEWKNTSGNWQTRVLGISLAASLFANLLLNGNFYMKLSEYQAGIKMAEEVKNKQIPKPSIYMYDWENYSFQYYTANIYPVLKTAEDWQQVTDKSFWVTGQINKVKEAAAINNFKVDSVQTYLDYRTTRLKGSFLNPATRASVCDTVVLAHISK